MTGTFLLAGAIALGSGATAIATVEHGTGVVPCGPKAQCLCQAAAIKDKTEREAALLSLLAKGLESADHEVRKQTWEYLARIDHSIDPRLLQSSLERFDELEEDSRGRGMVEWSNFEQAGRQTHLNAYHRAIADGHARIGSVTVITRDASMFAAARECLGELRGAIRDHLGSELVDGRDTDFEAILIRLDLCGGAENEADGNARAARRLDAVPAGELQAKLAQRQAWRRVVADTALASCKDAACEACTMMKAVLGRQRALLFDERKRVAASWNFRAAPIPKFSRTNELLTEWTEGLP